MVSIDSVLYKKSYGLLSMTLHPDFKNIPHLFVHYTYTHSEPHEKQIIESRIVRYSYDIRRDTLLAPEIILDNIPGKTYHNGSRMIITDENKLLFSMGDAGAKERAQNPRYLNGKILRMNLDGSIPEDNPFSGSRTWSYGHRNAQGLVQAEDETVYSSEHGVNHNDEINIIKKGQNYGWPVVEGYCDEQHEQQSCEKKNITEPLKVWSPTIAPAGLEVYEQDVIPEWQNSLLLATLKGRSLRVLSLSAKGNSITNEHIYFQKRFGRLRDVSVSTKGDIYLSTSNTDWHPNLQPWMYNSLPPGKDRILKLSRADKKMLANLDPKKYELTKLTENPDTMKLQTENYNFAIQEEDVSTGRQIYLEYCSACHQPDGSGVPDLYPPLDGTEWVNGDKSRLIRLMLTGLSEQIEVKGELYEQEMPAFQKLSDKEVAQVLTYIRNAFGNDAGAVIKGEVREERKGLRN